MTKHLYILLALAAYTTISAGDPTPLRYVKNEAFGFGERLEYSVGYKFITAGYAVFQVGKDPIVINEQNCYDIRFDVASLSSLEFLYKVRDRYRTMVDINGLFPWRFEQIIREGGFSKDFSAAFDQKGNSAVTTEGTFKIPPFVHDVVSALYHVRTYDLRNMKKGEVISMQNFFDRETHDLQIKVLGRQQIEVEAGTFNTIVIEPIIKKGGLFKSEGRIIIWLSDDDRKIPVKVSTKILIGSVDAELTSYKGLRGPLTSKVANPD
ncbi:MAG: DUF3108 domain-containing protein [bacterium]|nr:DUF3108 domain-containing protein [bacterium]